MGSRRPLVGDRTVIVSGRGPKPAQLMIVGEMPGEWEASTGIPFHSKAAVGKELTRYLHQVLRLDRDEVFLTNLIPEYIPDRDITRADVRKWAPTLEKDLAEVQSAIIMTIGHEATRDVLG